MATNESEKIQIPKFDGKNFTQWKFRVDLLLEEKNLKLFVESDLDSLEEKAKNDNEKEQLIIVKLNVKI